MKVQLNRIKKDLINASPNAPDYEGFTKIESKYFYVRGWYKSMSSDLDLYFQEINNEWIDKNKFNSSKFTNWLKNNK
jgi:hypothetical protein